MTIATENNLGSLFKKWFDKSFLETSHLDFNDEKCFRDVLEIFKADYRRYFENQITFESFNTRIELIGILLYRVARYYYLDGKEEFADTYGNLGRLISGFELYYSSDIGEGLKINHGLGTVIGARSKIGKNALLHQQVTLGERNEGRPVLKNAVTVYAGAKILGGITVGDGAIIGANAVCLHDIPAGVSVAGIPAKIIKK